MFVSMNSYNITQPCMCMPFGEDLTLGGIVGEPTTATDARQCSAPQRGGTSTTVPGTVPGGMVADTHYGHDIQRQLENQQCRLEDFLDIHGRIKSENRLITIGCLMSWHCESISEDRMPMTDFQRRYFCMQNPINLYNHDPKHWEVCEAYEMMGRKADWAIEVYTRAETFLLCAYLRTKGFLMPELSLYEAYPGCHYLMVSCGFRGLLEVMTDLWPVCVFLTAITLRVDDQPEIAYSVRLGGSVIDGTEDHEGVWEYHKFRDMPRIAPVVPAKRSCLLCRLKAYELLRVLNCEWPETHSIIHQLAQQHNCCDVLRALKRNLNADCPYHDHQKGQVAKVDAIAHVRAMAKVHLDQIVGMCEGRKFDRYYKAKATLSGGILRLTTGIPPTNGPCFLVACQSLGLETSLDAPAVTLAQAEKYCREQKIGLSIYDECTGRAVNFLGMPPSGRGILYTQVDQSGKPCDHYLPYTSINYKVQFKVHQIEKQETKKEDIPEEPITEVWVKPFVMSSVSWVGQTVLANYFGKRCDVQNLGKSLKKASEPIPLRLGAHLGGLWRVQRVMKAIDELENLSTLHEQALCEREEQHRLQSAKRRTKKVRALGPKVLGVMCIFHFHLEALIPSACATEEPTEKFDPLGLYVEVCPKFDPLGIGVEVYPNVIAWEHWEGPFSGPLLNFPIVGRTIARKPNVRDPMLTRRRGARATFGVGIGPDAEIPGVLVPAFIKVPMLRVEPWVLPEWGRASYERAEAAVSQINKEVNKHALKALVCQRYCCVVHAYRKITARRMDGDFTTPVCLDCPDHEGEPVPDISYDKLSRAVEDGYVLVSTDDGYTLAPPGEPKVHAEATVPCRTINEVPQYSPRIAVGAHAPPLNATLVRDRRVMFRPKAWIRNSSVSEGENTEPSMARVSTSGAEFKAFWNFSVCWGGGEQELREASPIGLGEVRPNCWIYSLKGALDPHEPRKYVTGCYRLDDIKEVRTTSGRILTPGEVYHVVHEGRDYELAQLQHVQVEKFLPLWQRILDTWDPAVKEPVQTVSLRPLEYDESLVDCLPEGPARVRALAHLIRQRMDPSLVGIYNDAIAEVLGSLREEKQSYSPLIIARHLRTLQGALEGGRRWQT